MKIGVFDSGAGGLCALERLAALLPGEEFLFFADRKNAPYGTKCREELIALCRADIARLRERGADRILIACCTASTVYPFLTDGEKQVCTPILFPAAKAAAAHARGRRVGVISTEATARSGAFVREIRKIAPAAKVSSVAAQSLVALVESGVRDGRISQKDKEKISLALSPLPKEEIGALILGCTHFSRLKRTIGELLPGVRIVDAAEEGAAALADRLIREGSVPKRQPTGVRARITYLE